MAIQCSGTHRALQWIAFGVAVVSIAENANALSMSLRPFDDLAYCADVIAVVQLKGHPSEGSLVDAHVVDVMKGQETRETIRFFYPGMPRICIVLRQIYVPPREGLLLLVFLEKKEDGGYVLVGTNPHYYPYRSLPFDKRPLTSRARPETAPAIKSNDYIERALRDFPGSQAFIDRVRANRKVPTYTMSTTAPAETKQQLTPFHLECSVQAIRKIDRPEEKDVVVSCVKDLLAWTTLEPKQRREAIRRSLIGSDTTARIMLDFIMTRNIEQNDASDELVEGILCRIHSGNGYIRNRAVQCLAMITYWRKDAVPYLVDLIEVDGEGAIARAYLGHVMKREGIEPPKPTESRDAQIQAIQSWWLTCGELDPRFKRFVPTSRPANSAAETKP